MYKRLDAVGLTDYVVDLQAGNTLKCSTCTTRVLIMQLPVAALIPECCGERMLTSTPNPCSAPQLFLVRDAVGSFAGSWYIDVESGLVLRCTHGGRGAIVYAGRTLTRMATRPGAVARA
ncbi:hypothetical protein M6B22_06755 [Jatrophihabitans cynanchi]|uniref:Uncharacterized protein n=1 Tax=Jatrophihabitans cynanchi TaxID=2944128 RepID=A0ABY7K4I2_9ACTN|nr:hypothetical protein [Jatrophihabitans sp. SB3-54]WAX58457.1 hypothetical protein M6B22_06755 [Jatrophihabitans sp. SB3-54]